MILSFCYSLFRFLMKECNLVKRASWPPTTRASVCISCQCKLLHGVKAHQQNQQSQHMGNAHIGIHYLIFPLHCKLGMCSAEAKYIEL